jgi:hypothetical protein
MTYMLPALVSLMLASVFQVPGFLDSPLTEITVRECLSELLFLAASFACLAFLSRSIERDSMWPWYRRPLPKN